MAGLGGFECFISRLFFICMYLFTGDLEEKSSLYFLVMFESRSLPYCWLFGCYLGTNLSIYDGILLRCTPLPISFMDREGSLLTTLSTSKYRRSIFVYFMFDILSTSDTDLGMLVERLPLSDLWDSFWLMKFWVLTRDEKLSCLNIIVVEIYIYILMLLRLDSCVERRGPRYSVEMEGPIGFGFGLPDLNVPHMYQNRSNMIHWRRIVTHSFTPSRPASTSFNRSSQRAKICWSTRKWNDKYRSRAWRRRCGFAKMWYKWNSISMMVTAQWSQNIDGQ